jgi:hypothetical protein
MVRRKIEDNLDSEGENILRKRRNMYTKIAGCIIIRRPMSNNIFSTYIYQNKIQNT